MTRMQIIRWKKILSLSLFIQPTRNQAKYLLIQFTKTRKLAYSLLKYRVKLKLQEPYTSNVKKIKRVRMS